MALKLLLVVSFMCMGCKKKDKEKAASDDTTAATSSTLVDGPESVDHSLRYDSLTMTPLITWSAVASASSYEVAIGLSEYESDVMEWRDVGDVLEVSFDNLTLSNGTHFYATVRAQFADGSYSSSQISAGWQNLVCPTDWVKVPGDLTFGLGGPHYTQGSLTRHDGSTRNISDFCVMKFEAKLHNGTAIVTDGNDSNTFDYNSPGDAYPISSSEGRPWVRVKKREAADALDAERACELLNNKVLVEGATNFIHLINNNQWQVIARNIEKEQRNIVGGLYNRGHSDNTPNSSCDAANEYVDIACAEDSATPHLQKRTHLLSNDAIIWDFSGNAWESVIDELGTGKSINPEPSLDINADIEYSNADCSGEVCFSALNRGIFGPEDTSLNSTDGISSFYGSNGDYGGLFLRSGYYNSGTKAGIYSANLGREPNWNGVAIGFRCAWSP